MRFCALAGVMISFVFTLFQQIPSSSPSSWPLALFGLGIVVGLGLLYRRAYRSAGAGSTSDSAEGGVVYVLRNPTHDDLVKIGYTTRSAGVRARELSSPSGVSEEFEVEHEEPVANPRAVERAVHDRLSAYRRNSNKEFFAVSPATARQAIRRVAGTGASRRGLGIVLLALALLGATALFTHHPPDDDLVRSMSLSEMLRSTSSQAESSSVQNALGSLGAWAASRLAPNGLGYVGALPLLGLIGLAGVALALGRSPRPLLLPMLLCLVAATAAAGLVGSLVPPRPETAVGWNGTPPPPSPLARWAGAWGLAVAEQSRVLLGALGALLSLGATVGGCGTFLVWWSR